MSNEIWLYPKMYNQLYSNSKIKIVEKVYEEDVLKELNTYLQEIQQLQEENKLLRECVELLEKIQLHEINPDRVIYDEIEILLTKIKGDENG